MKSGLTFIFTCSFIFLTHFPSLCTITFSRLCPLLLFSWQRVSWGRSLRAWAQVEPQLGRIGGWRRKAEERNEDEDTLPYATQRGPPKNRKHMYSCKLNKQTKTSSLTRLSLQLIHLLFSTHSLSLSLGRGLAGLGLNAICCIM